MKILLSAILLILALPSAGLCESCDALAKQLVRLRGEYHGYATADEAQKKLTTFDDLTGKLDEIIEVKDSTAFKGSRHGQVSERTGGPSKEKQKAQKPPTPPMRSFDPVDDGNCAG